MDGHEHRRRACRRAAGHVSLRFYEHAKACSLAFARRQGDEGYVERPVLAHTIIEDLFEEVVHNRAVHVRLCVNEKRQALDVAVAAGVGRRRERGRAAVLVGVLSAGATPQCLHHGLAVVRHDSVVQGQLRGPGGACRPLHVGRALHRIRASFGGTLIHDRISAKDTAHARILQRADESCPHHLAVVVVVRGLGRREHILERLVAVEKIEPERYLVASRILHVAELGAFERSESVRHSGLRRLRVKV
eukprot:190572-Prymnesium_polylepis.2